MSRRQLTRTAMVALAVWAGFCAAAAAEQEITVGSGRGYLEVPAGAKAGVVLVSGAGGMSPRDLLMRTRAQFAGYGLATLMIANDNSPLRAVEELRRYVPSVTLVGMSAGTVSAARAIRNGAAPRRLVLVSGVLMPGSGPNSVQSIMGSPRALPPTLVIHNRQEACDRTPASAVEPFVAWSGGRARAAWISSTSVGGNPCGPMHYHGYPGSEANVVAAIARFALD